MRLVKEKPATTAFHQTKKSVDHLNPTRSYSAPAVEGPTKAPRAKVEVQMLETVAKVLTVLGKPRSMAAVCASLKAATRSAASPAPATVREPAVVL